MRHSALFAQDRTIRREIRRWWTDNPRWVAWLMLNPSNANEMKDDPTTLRVTRFTAAWGYDGWVGVNLYPFISSDPARMWDWAAWKRNGPDWQVRDILSANKDDIERVARLASLRVAAFGAQPATRGPRWLEACLEAFGQPSDIHSDEAIYCLAVNQTGQPLHPMARGKWRVPDDAKPILWRQ